MPSKLTKLFRDDDFPTMSYEQAIEIIKGGGNGMFMREAHEHRIFQIWNKTYLDALASEIKCRIGDELVIEVCAGNGTLSRELWKRGVTIIATDNKSWELVKHGIDVKKMDAIEAVRTYKPKMVIASWIPYTADIDLKLLKTGVQFVMLIGETNGGCCGSEEVWHEYENLNYMLTYLHKIDKFNLCRTDAWFGEKMMKHFHTVLFKKISDYEYKIPNSLWGDEKNV